MIKLLTKEEKAHYMIGLWMLTVENFKGVEVPPRKRFESDVEKGEVFVVEVNGTLAGFALVTERGNQPYVVVICVTPIWRNLGYCTDMLNEIERWAKQHQKSFVELTTKIDNPAQIVYFKNGYRVRQVAREFYGHEGDGLVMRRTLCQN